MWSVRNNHLNNKPTRIIHSGAWVMLFITMMLALSCKTTREPAGITPTLERRLPELPVSTINIPVKIHMKPLLSQMDSSTSKIFTSENWPDFLQSSCDFRYKYRFLRSPFYFSCNNNIVQINFRGYYQIAGSKRLCTMGRQVSPWVTGTCGFGNESLRKVDLSIRSQLQLTRDHQVLTNTRLEKIQPLDKCEVTLMQNDVTTQIMDSIRSSVETYTRSFDNFVADLNNSPVLQEWRKGSRVMPILTYGYMNLFPSQLNVSPFNYYNDTLHFMLGFSGRPSFSSDSLRLTSASPLPAVTNLTQPAHIETYLDASYDYGFFNRLLNDSLSNKPFTVEGKTFVINRVQVGGTPAGKINLRVDFSGYKNGSLSLTGTPQLDSLNQVISMPDISFSVDSRDMLVNIAKGLFRKKVMKELRNQSVLDIRELISRNKATIEARLNQQVTEWMSSRGSLNDLRVVGLMATDKHLQIQVYINANLEIIGSPPPW